MTTDATGTSGSDLPCSSWLEEQAVLHGEVLPWRLIARRDVDRR